MSTRLADTREAFGVCTKARSCEQVAFFLGEVTEGREGYCVGVIHQPRKFARIEGRLDLALDFVTEGLGQVAVCTELRVERRKECQTVLDDRAADIATGIEFRIPIRSEAHERKVLGVTDK